MGLFGAEIPGPLRPGRSFELSFGGSESNVAIGVARLGEQATWMGVVGSDAIGDLIIREMRAEGVTVRAQRHSVAPTSIMVKERPWGNNTRVLYYRRGGAGSQLAMDDIDIDVVRSAGVLHVTGITAALSERMSDLTVEVMQIARASGVPVSVDLNYRAKLWTAGEARKHYARLLKHADLVFASVDEAKIATGYGENPIALAHALNENGPTESIVTLGPRGAISVVDEEIFEAPGVPVQAIDTVGAGDAFVAGYLTEMLRGTSPERRLALGNCLGAHVCLVSGDWEGLPTSRDLVSLKDPVQR